jgi:tetratricopeptide (TPR) repeat protein
MLALFAGPAAFADWIQLASPSFEIFTDSGEKTARAVLSRFEALHRIFHESPFADSAPPLRVFVFSSQREFEKYRTIPLASGFYLADQDMDFIVFDEGTALKRVAAHEYMHAVMHHASPLLPAWLDEGVSEFYSTVSISANKVHIGDPIEPHLHLLSTELWLPAEDLALGSAADGAIFYAESWALVHMLSLSPGLREGMPEFVKLLTAGRDQDEAFQKSFGMPMEDALAALRVYVKTSHDLTLPAPPLEEGKAYPVTHVAPVDSTLMLADLALHTNHPELASSLFSRAAKENPRSPAAVAGLGMLALAENRKQDAQHEFERAIGLGSRDANTYFQLAMLKDDHALLEKTLTIDPHFAEAHFLLGVHATDDGNFPFAIEHLRQALASQPRRFTYWHALGYAQVKSGDRQAAAESARRAIILASDSEEEKMAASLTLLVSEPPTAARKKKPDVITPPSWQNPKGDARVEGTLTRVDCDSVPLRLVVSAEPGKTIELNVPNPTAVELINAEGASTTLVCGEQSRPIAAEYFAATGAITRIEFRPVVIMKR